MATIYKIDYNRGSDSNNGTSAPWKNLSKIASMTPASGDVVALANDSYWEQTNRVALPTSTAGTASSPLLITNYDPGGAPSSKPTISFRRSIPANEWTYDAPNNGWYWDASPITTSSLHFGAYVLLGGEDGTRQENAIPLSTVDKAWRESTKFLYVYAPAGIDPTTYYGSVIFGHPHCVFTFSNSANYLIVENLRVQNGAGLLYVYSNGGNRTVVVRGIESRDAVMPIRLGPDVGSNLVVDIHDCDFLESQSIFVHAGGANVGAGVIRIRNNRFVGGNRAYAQGQIYLQARVGSVLVSGNDCSGAEFASTQFKPADGCAIYAEVGSDRAVIVGNYIHDQYQALQDNCGRGAIWMGNIVERCYRGMHVSDGSTVGSMNHRFYNNTMLVGIPHDTAYGPTDAGKGWRAYGTSSSHTVDVRNNIIVDIGGTCDKAGILTPQNTWTGTLAYNCVHGFPAIAAKEFAGGAGASPTSTNSFDNDPLLSGYGLSEGSPCIGAGTYIAAARHAGGQRLTLGASDIGAVRSVPGAARSIAASRTSRMGG